MRELAGEAWKAKIDRFRLELADPAIWSRDDRHRVFSGLELADRIAEAARTAERLFQRYSTERKLAARASRELAARLALQLYNLRQGMDDLAAEAPVDALLSVDPALDAGGEGGDSAEWCKRLTDMYCQWAAKRRMQIKEVAPRANKGRPVYLITGFGAFRTLEAECGLHVLEEDQGADGARRLVARVTSVGGPERGLSASSEFAVAAQLLASVPVANGIVRRYREEPAPLVRDMVGGGGRADFPRSSAVTSTSSARSSASSLRRDRECFCRRDCLLSSTIVVTERNVCPWGGVLWVHLR